MSGFSDFFLGAPAQNHQLSTVTPDQEQYLQELLQGLRTGNPQGFQPIENRARSQFAQQTVPSLAERFTSMGQSGGGALSSPAFASQLGSAGAGLEEGLAALKSQFGLQQLQAALMPRFENMYQQAGEGVLGPLLQAAGTAAGTYFGGPSGGQFGGNVGKSAGNGLRSMFSQQQAPNYRSTINDSFNQFGKSPFGANASPFQYSAGVL